MLGSGFVSLDDDVLFLLVLGFEFVLSYDVLGCGLVLSDDVLLLLVPGCGFELSDVLL